MHNHETAQLSALLESLIDEYGHNIPKLKHGLVEKLPMYFMGEDVKKKGNQIILTRVEDDFKERDVGIIEIYEGDLKGNFPASMIESLKTYKKEKSLNFAFLVAFNSNNHIKIREVDDKTSYLNLDYNT